MSNRIIWDYCKDEGGGSSLEFCTVCPFWELIWVVCMVIPSIVLPYGAGRLKVSCSFSYRSRIKNKQSNTQLSQEEGGKRVISLLWEHNSSTFCSHNETCLPRSVPGGPREAEGCTWKKKLSISWLANNNGKSNEVVP